MVKLVNFKGVLLLSLLGSYGTAQSEVYKYVDEDGNVTYSSARQKGATKYDPPPLTVVPPIRAPKESKTPSSTATADNEARRKNIEEKIAAETKLLEQARREYNGGELERTVEESNYQKYLDRAQRLKDNIALHEKNIGALQVELQNRASPGKE